MNFIKKRYNNFDLLRIPISLSYKKEYLFKTFVGATLTIAAFFIIILYFIFKIKDLVQRTNFSITTNEYQSPKETINFKNIPILFSLTDNDGNPIQLNSQIFDFSVVFSNYIQHFDQYGNSNITHEEIDIEIDRCDNMKGSLDLSYFESFNISSFKCIKPWQDLILSGIFGDITGYTSFKINVKKCDNATQKCLNNDYIESFLSNARLLVIYLGYKTNFYNKNEKDTQQIICSRSVPLSSFFNKRVFLYMSIVKYKLYDNLLFNTKKESIYFISKDMRIEYKPYHDISVNDTFYNNVYGFFAFVYDGNVVEYTKKVEKFGEIVSYIGNFFNIVLTLFKIINNYFSNKILFIDIFHLFFYEKKLKKFNKSINLENSSLNPLNKSNSNSLKINSKTQDKSVNSNLNFNFSSFHPDKSLDNSNNNSKNNISNSINNAKTKKNKDKLLFKSQKDLEKKKLLRQFKLYYLCPLFRIKNKNNTNNNLFSIKNSICNTFSFERFVEFIKTTKSFNKMKKDKAQDNRYFPKKNCSEKNLKLGIKKIISFK
jgi:hypothetical protein